MRWQKRASWPIAILQKWKIWEKCIEDLAQIEKRCQKRHVDTCGFYEMNILRNRWIWQGLRQWDNKTGKLTVGDFHKNGKFEKMGNWARIHQRSGKTSFEVTKRGILRKGRFRQIWRVCQKNHQGFGQIFKWDDKKGHVDSWRFLGQWQILQRWRIWQEVIKGLTKIYKEMTKRGILTNGDYKKRKIGQQFI